MQLVYELDDFTKSGGWRHSARTTCAGLCWPALTCADCASKGSEERRLLVFLLSQLPGVHQTTHPVRYA